MDQIQLYSPLVLFLEMSYLLLNLFEYVNLDKHKGVSYNERMNNDSYVHMNGGKYGK